MVAPSFEARLVRPEGVGTWTLAQLPAAVVAREGLRSHSRVVGTIDGAPFRSTCLPRGGGALCVVIPQAIRTQIGKSAGDSVRFVLALDSNPVVLRVPKDFATALGAARPKFDRLAPSRRKAFLTWIAEAKQPATRARRVVLSAAMVRRGEKLN